MRDVLSITTRNCMVVVVIDSLKRATEHNNVVMTSHLKQVRCQYEI